MWVCDNYLLVYVFWEYHEVGRQHESVILNPTTTHGRHSERVGTAFLFVERHSEAAGRRVCLQFGSS